MTFPRSAAGRWCLLLLLAAVNAAGVQRGANGHLAPRNRGGQVVADDGVLRSGAPSLVEDVTEDVVEEKILRQRPAGATSVIRRRRPLARTTTEAAPLDETEVIADVVEEPSTVAPKSHAQLIAEELQRRADEQIRRDAELLKRADLKAAHDLVLAEELQRRAEEQIRRDEELEKRAKAKVAYDLVIAEEQIRRDAELQNRAEEQLRRDEELERRKQHDKLVDEELERRKAAAAIVEEELNRRKEAEEELERRAAAEAAVTEKVVSHVTPAVAVAVHSETVTRRPIRTRNRGGGHGPRRTASEDFRFKRHQDTTVDDIELRKQEEQRIHSENLNRKEEIEIHHLEADLMHEAAGQSNHEQEAYEHELINKEREERIKKLERERKMKEEEITRQEATKKENERHQDTTVDDIELRKKEEQRIHSENLNKKEEMEIHQLEAGLMHEAAGKSKHEQEAHQHELINKEREELIKKLEWERKKKEDEIIRQEVIRKEEEIKRFQIAQEEIIQNENHKREIVAHNHDHGTVTRADALSGAKSSTPALSALLCFLLAVRLIL